jgi:hypothetical protein
MPSRSVTLVILAFWLLMAGWLFHADLLPRWQADEPAPFTIPLMDEPRISLYWRNGRIPREVETLWNVFQNNRSREDLSPGEARTRIEFTEGDDALIFFGEFKAFHGHDRTYPVIKSVSYGRVNWDGELLGMAGQLEARLPPTNPDAQVVLNFEAPVTHGHLWPVWYLDSGERRDEPVPLSARGNILVLTQPMNRVIGLRAGQRWHLPQLNLLAFLTQPAGVPVCTVEAVVGEGELMWFSQKVPCFIIDYLGDEPTRARTWVRKRDGLVLQQEFTHGDRRFLIERQSQQ